MSMSGRTKNTVWRGFGVFQCFINFIPPKTKMAKIQLQMAVFLHCHQTVMLVFGGVFLSA